MKPRAFEAIRHYLLNLQNVICAALEAEDGEAGFDADPWRRPGGGGGETRVLEGGSVLARAGVNFSDIAGDELPPSATVQRQELAGAGFRALGLSVVVHPVNPYAPTSHLNVRVFAAGETAWWFGGGYDLTPVYGFAEDCRHWHRVARDTCEPFGAGLYAELKAQCDRYFFLPHRGEARGIGGIFFDDFKRLGFERSFAFMRAVGDSYLDAYRPILAARKNTPYGERERQFQGYRRGRYVEFNLVRDRGTLFGLQSGGRAESILMSLPPAAGWRYDFHPQAGTAEAELYEKFLPPRDWLADQ